MEVIGFVLHPGEVQNQSLMAKPLNIVKPSLNPEIFWVKSVESSNISQIQE